MDELLLQVAESLRKSLALSAAEVWTGSGGRLERAVSVPDAPPARLTLVPDEQTVVARAGVSGQAWVKVWMAGLLRGREDVQMRVAPAAHSGQLLGLIVAVRPAAGDAFRPEDDLVLAELARQVGLALHNVALDSALQASLDEVRRQAEELRASRARVVAAADAARRQIERNLHDGAQQHLVALAVNIRLVSQLAAADPAAAKEMLDQLGRDVQNAVEELRSLAHGIYPPLLVDRGLPEALRAAAGRAALPTDVVADGIGRYPQAVEAAVYFCCLEALQNAGKHAGEGASATVRVWEEEGALLFQVSDDGAGFDPAARSSPGAGFVNMGDRVGAIGGSVDVASSPGEGTRISGRIPLVDSAGAPAPPSPSPAT
jgi:signal transduction histidine kinase